MTMIFSGCAGKQSIKPEVTTPHIKLPTTDKFDVVCVDCGSSLLDNKRDDTLVLVQILNKAVPVSAPTPKQSEEEYGRLQSHQKERVLTLYILNIGEKLKKANGRLLDIKALVNGKLNEP